MWHVEKRHLSGFADAAKLKATVAETLRHYSQAAIDLCMSMEAFGFDPVHAIPIDPTGELLGGAHRLSCALALNKTVCVTHEKTPVWAPAWDLKWFIDHGMSEPDLQRLKEDMQKILAVNS